MSALISLARIIFVLSTILYCVNSLPASATRNLHRRRRNSDFSSGSSIEVSASQEDEAESDLQAVLKSISDEEKDLRSLRERLEKDMNVQKLLRHHSLRFEENQRYETSVHPRKDPAIDHRKNHHKIKHHDLNEDYPEVMQSDQPVPGEDLPSQTISYNATSNGDYLQTMRERMRDNWLEILKQNILSKTGRTRENPSIHYPKISESGVLEKINFSSIINSLQSNDSQTNEERQISEKIRSFYPSCEMPRNTDEELWKNESVLNLFFNVDHSADETTRIASSFLRVYRLPSQNVTKNGTSLDAACEYSDDKLFRVSVYWYTRPLRKNNRPKRRLSDSKMVSENAKWVELSIRPALKAWAKFRNKNLGLSIEVEDQDGNYLRPADFFKGQTCTVGMSTPKPIPTVVLDAARRSYELDRANGIVGENSTSTVHSGVFMLPTVDICYLEFPDNFSYAHLNIENLKTNACNMMKVQEQCQKGEQRNQLEKFISLEPNIRHHHNPPHHHSQRHPATDGLAEDDIRLRMRGVQLVIPNHELFNRSSRNR